MHKICKGLRFEPDHHKKDDDFEQNIIDKRHEKIAQKKDEMHAQLTKDREEKRN